MTNQQNFKTCPMCAKKWAALEDFLEDRSLEINGYQADFEDLEWGLFYFTHRTEGCYSTMAIRAKDFFSLYSGTKYPERRAGMEECPRYCLDDKQLNRCDALCECAFNREIIQVIKEKQVTASSRQ